MKKLLHIIFLVPFALFGQLELPYSIKMVNAKPPDYFYYNSSGIPYTSTTQVNSQIPVLLRYQGMTVNVAGEEYCYKYGTADINLIIKGGTPSLPNGNLITWNGSGYDLGGNAIQSTLFNIDIYDFDIVSASGDLRLFFDQSNNALRLSSGGSLSLNTPGTGNISMFSGSQGIIIDPFSTGITNTGITVFKRPGSNPGEIRITDSGGSNFVSFKSPSSLSTNYAYTWPSAGPTGANQVLTADQSTLEMSWVNQSGGGSYASLSDVTASSPATGHVGEYNSSTSKWESKYPGMDVTTQSGTSYTLVASDNNKIIEFTNSSAITVTLPNSMGRFSCVIVKAGTGDVTIVATGTLTPSAGTTIQIFGGMATVYHRGSNAWMAAGSFGTAAASYSPNNITITSGSSSTLSNAVTLSDISVLFNPASLLSSYTVTMPSTPIDGQGVTYFFGGTITATNTVVTSLTISPNTAQSIMQSLTPTTAKAGDTFTYVYRAATSTWYRKF